MLLDWRCQLNRLEQFSRRAGEDGHAVRRRPHLRLEIAPDLVQVAIEAFALGRVLRVGAPACLELFANERLILIPAVLSRLCIEIQADHWVWCRFECRKAVELFSQSHTGSSSITGRVPRAGLESSASLVPVVASPSRPESRVTRHQKLHML